MADKIVYAQDGVHQCWTCRHMVGRSEGTCWIHDADGIEQCMVVVLPECKVTERYMTSVYETPCSKYVPYFAPTGNSEQTIQTVHTSTRPGHWKYQTMSVPGGKGQTYSKWSCSVCKTKQPKRSKFCPECGTRMEDMTDGKD